MAVFWPAQSIKFRHYSHPTLFEFDSGHLLVLTMIIIVVSIWVMTRRVTANLPEDLLRDAMDVTGKGITDTLVEGLRRVRRSRAFDKAQALRGKIELKICLEESRERARG